MGGLPGAASKHASEPSHRHPTGGMGPIPPVGWVAEIPPGRKVGSGKQKWLSGGMDKVCVLVP